MVFPVLRFVVGLMAGGQLDSYEETDFVSAIITLLGQQEIILDPDSGSMSVAEHTIFRRPFNVSVAALSRPDDPYNVCVRMMSTPDGLDKFGYLHLMLRVVCSDERKARVLCSGHLVSSRLEFVRRAGQMVDPSVIHSEDNTAPFVFDILEDVEYSVGLQLCLVLRLMVGYHTIVVRDDDSDDRSSVVGLLDAGTDFVGLDRTRIARWKTVLCDYLYFIFPDTPGFDTPGDVMSWISDRHIFDVTSQYLHS